MLCEKCAVAIDATGCCPRCGVDHSGDPCPGCGRRGYHTDECWAVEPLRRGDHVKVINTGLGGKQFVEGVAILRRQLDKFGERWDVEFLNERGRIFPRFIEAANRLSPDEVRALQPVS